MPERAKPTADGTFPWVCSGCVEPTFKGPVMIRLVGVNSLPPATSYGGDPSRTTQRTPT